MALLTTLHCMSDDSEPEDAVLTRTCRAPAPEHIVPNAKPNADECTGVPATTADQPRDPPSTSEPYSAEEHARVLGEL